MNLYYISTIIYHIFINRYCTHFLYKGSVLRPGAGEVGRDERLGIATYIRYPVFSNRVLKSRRFIILPAESASAS